MKYNRGQLVKIVPSSDWLEDIAPSTASHKPKESEIGLCGTIIGINIVNREKVYSVEIDKFEKYIVYLNEEYLSESNEETAAFSKRNKCMNHPNISREDYNSWLKSQETIKVEAYAALIKNRKEVENMNKNIVKMWAQKMKEGYMKSKDTKISRIKDADFLLTKKMELEKEMSKAMEAAGLNMDNIRPLVTFENIQARGGRIASEHIEVNSILSEVSKTTINKVIDKYIIKAKIVDDKMDEVITMIEGCETYEKTIDVLQAYNIVDSKGKLSLPDSFDLE